MKILTIDSTLNKLYLTLGGDDFFESKIVESTDEKYHSAFIASAVAELFKSHSIKPENLDAIAVNIGPGSFTGIRVGIAFARVIAQAHNIKTLGVSSLEILAKLNPTGQDTLVIMDARKGKAYAAIYGVENLSPCALPLDEILQLVKSGKYFVISDGRMAKYLSGNSLESLNYENSDADLGKADQRERRLSETSDEAKDLLGANRSEMKEDEPPIIQEADFGKFLFEIAQQKLKLEDDFNWANLKPLYIQPPPITMPKK